ncbi:hypothetical protein C8R42DRAFT_728083 [Lentinula raphanica]|nr:hypothetical protein C8R42DRAFT_728083 [Lentinula raphanica]
MKGYSEASGLNLFPTLNLSTKPALNAENVERDSGPKNISLQPFSDTDFHHRATSQTPIHLCCRPIHLQLGRDRRDSCSFDYGEKAEKCLEEKVYYQVTSGLHASISTQCLGHLPTSTLSSFSALSPKRSPTSRSTTIFRASPMKKSARPIGTSRKWWIWLGRLGDSMKDKCSRGLDAMSLREDFKAHFQIVCDQCRSWGNVQTAGPATAMKILCSTSFALNSSSKIVIQRSELAALSNTPNRFSESIQAATRFMSMAQLPAHADPEERIDNNNVRGGFGDDFSATDTYLFPETNTYESSVYSYRRGRVFALLVCGIRV